MSRADEIMKRAGFIINKPKCEVGITNCHTDFTMTIGYEGSVFTVMFKPECTTVRLDKDACYENDNFLQALLHSDDVCVINSNTTLEDMELKAAVIAEDDSSEKMKTIRQVMGRPILGIVLKSNDAKSILPAIKFDESRIYDITYTCDVHAIVNQKKCEQMIANQKGFTIHFRSGVDEFKLKVTIGKSLLLLDSDTISRKFVDELSKRRNVEKLTFALNVKNLKPTTDLVIFNCGVGNQILNTLKKDYLLYGDEDMFMNLEYNIVEWRTEVSEAGGILYYYE